MQRSQLEHVIRAAAEITNQYEFVVIGSQSILGTVEHPPADCTLSMEVDLHPLNAPELADLIDGAIGELSFFHDHFGYCAQGVGPDTAHLTTGWEGRLTRLQRVRELPDDAESARVRAWIQRLALPPS